MVFDPTKKLVQDVTPSTPTPASPAPLSRDAFIDPTTGAERPINNAVTNPTNYQSDLANQQKNAVTNNQINDIAHDTTLAPEVKLQKIQALTATKVAPVGISDAMRTQMGNEVNLPQNQYTPVRDVSLENKTAAKFGLDSSNPADVVSGLTTTYKTPQINQMLIQGEVNTSAFNSQNLKDLGLTQDRISQLMSQAKTPEEKARIQGLYDTLNKTGAMGAQVESTLNATPAPNNNMMNVLSEALNAKSNYKNQALGTSDLFKMAGLSGYSVLADSMNQRMNEMKDKAQSAQSLIATSGGAMASTYKAISDNYNKIMDQYDKQTKMLLDIDKQAKDHEQALDLMKQQDELEKKTYAWKKSVDSQYANDKWTHVSATENQPAGRFNTVTGEFVPDAGGSMDNSSTSSNNSGGWLSGVANFLGLGSISGKYESGNDYGRVSTGAGDAGGVSYGSHQFSSKMGSLNTFLKDSGYAKDFAGMTPGTAAFNNKWKELAKDPAFQKAQDKQIETKYYQPMVDKLQKGGLDLSGRSQPVHEMIYSTSVQYGPNSNVIKDALKGKDVSKMTDEEIIKTVQTYKGNTVASYFGSSSQAVQNGVKNRTKNEMNDLISLGAKIGWKAGTSQGNMAPGLLGAGIGALAGAAANMMNPPKKSPTEQMYDLTGSLTWKDPKSTSYKEFMALSPEEQQRHIDVVTANKNKSTREI